MTVRKRRQRRMREAWDEKGRLIYVAPGYVRYDILHVEFLLPRLPELREGTGPTEPLGGYVGESRGGIKHHAPHEAWCQVAAEIDERLARTKTDRYLVEDYYCQNTGIEEIARQIEMEAWEVNRRINSAVSYIASGPCRRWISCIDCREYKTCDKQNKGRVGLTYREWVRRGGRRWREGRGGVGGIFRHPLITLRTKAQDNPSVPLDYTRGKS